MNFLEALKNALFFKALNFQGRSSRFEFYSFFVFIIFAVYLLLHLYAMPYAGIIYMASTVYFSICYLSLSIRRFHDLGLSGYLIFILIVPIAICVSILIVDQYIAKIESSNITLTLLLIAGVCSILAKLALLLIFSQKGNCEANQFGLPPTP